VNEDWQLFLLVVTGTDRLLHFMYDATLDESHPQRMELVKYFGEVDRVVGEFFERIGGREGFECLMLSDHGFVKLDREIFLNPILRNHGFQKADGKILGTPEEIGGDCLAFALDPSRIYIHRKEKYSRGGVAAADYSTIRREIKNSLENYSIAGSRVIRRVFLKEDIYDGDHLALAPDLVVLSEPGFNLKAGFGKSEEHDRTHFTGMHHRDNAFFYSSNTDNIPADMSIFDIFPLIFDNLGLSVPTRNARPI
jgi:predicted AlkP superfamily phosphohydrolase/phosphomutase